MRSYTKGDRMWCYSEENCSSCHLRSDTILSGNRVLTSAINTRATLDAESQKLTTTLPHILSYFQPSPNTHRSNNNNKMKQIYDLFCD